MIWLFVIILILFIPIPLKITANYTDKKIHIFFYNKELKVRVPKNKHKREKKITKKKNNIQMLKAFINFLDKSLIKLNINLNIDVAIGLEDAAHLAILYGILNTLNYPIHRIVSIVFNISNFEFNITPYFNKTIFSFKLKSIIYVTLAKLIYTAFNIIKFYYFHKKDFEREVQLSKA